MRPARAASRAAVASTSSSVLVGTSVMRLGRPGAWPLRPARCSNRAMPLALPICSTRSTGRKSTPRSSEEVATTAFNVPAFSPASTHSRTDLSREPWCSATTPAQSGRACSSSWYQASAWLRVLVKTRLVDALSISATTGASICAPRWPPHEKRPGCSGSSVSITSVLSTLPWTSTACSSAGPGPTSTSSASSRLPRVALSPHTTSAGFQVASRASASCTCTPRLLPISSCHSSTITVCTVAKVCGASSRLSITLSDSGVVTSAVGSRWSCRARSALGVSPVRSPTVQPGASSGSGSFSARAVSAASARIGVSHTTVSGGAAVLPVLLVLPPLPLAGEGGGEGARTPSPWARATAPNHTA